MILPWMDGPPLLLACWVEPWRPDAVPLLLACPALDAGAGGLGRWRLAGGRGGLAEVEERSGWGLGGARRRDREW